MADGPVAIGRERRERLVGADQRRSEIARDNRAGVGIVVPDGNPVTGALKPVEESLAPSFCAGVVLPYAVVVPNWNETFTAAPSGFTVPFSVAVDVVTLVAAAVTGVSAW